MKNQSKKILSVLFVVTLITFIYACKKTSDKAESYTCASCSQTPTAKSENNSSNKGMYKGVVVGSSGVIIFDLANSGATATAILTIDGQIVLLTSTITPQSGQPFNTTFTGTLNGQASSIVFTVGATGLNPTIASSNIPGHLAAVFQLYKETSDNLITCYEGTTSGIKDSGAAQSGQLNLVASTKTNTWLAISASKNNSSVGLVTGKISGNVFTCDCGTTTSVTGTLTGDQIDGTYKGSDNHGTWTAKRTL